MPLPPFLNSSSYRCLKGNFAKGLILGFFIVVFIGTLIWQTSERTNAEKGTPISTSTDNLDDPVPGDKTQLINLPKPSDFGRTESESEENNIWCQARDYVDLSENSVFRGFRNGPRLLSIIHVKKLTPAKFMIPAYCDP